MSLQSRQTTNILVVIRWPVGGIRTWCRYVYLDPVFSKYNITIVMPDDPQSSVLQKDLSHTNISFKILETQNSVSSFFSLVTKLILKGKWTLVHSHGFTSGLASSIPCKLKRIPHLVTPHDVVLENQHRGIKGKIVRIAVSWMLRGATRVQAVGHAAANNLLEAFPNAFRRKQHLLVVRNGIDTSRFINSKPKNIRGLLDISDNTIVVGFFGRFMAQKGFRYLVDAMNLYRKKHPNGKQIIVVTVGSGGFREQERNRIHSLGLDNYFRHLDFSDNIASLIKAVDVVAIPSIWEACPLLPMETLVCGVPMVISDCSACVEVAEGSPAKVIPMKSAAALIDGIVEMSDPKQIATSKKYSSIAVRKFNVSDTIEGINKLYSELLCLR